MPERFIILCGGNQEHVKLFQKYRELGEEFMIAMMNIIDQPRLEEMREMISGISVFCVDDMLQSGTTDLIEWQRAWHKARRIFKIYRMPLIRRLRCRWRQRESRHSLTWIGPQTVVLDMENDVDNLLIKCE